MATTAVATLQTIWDCRWGQPAFLRPDTARGDRYGSRWVCERTGGAVPVAEGDCESCPYWEYEPARSVAVDASPGIAVLVPVAAARTRSLGTDAAVADEPARPTAAAHRLAVAFRVLLLAAAATFAWGGFAVLTRPLALPLTFSLWLPAVVMFALGIWGHLPRTRA